METSAHYHNCLIHAFFTCLSSVYQTLSLPNKETVAECFRMSVLHRLALASTPIPGIEISYPQMISRITSMNRQSGRYLETDELLLLASFFKVNVLVQQGDGTACTYVLYNINPAYEYIIMNNSQGNNHFEACKIGERYRIAFASLPINVRNGILYVVGIENKAIPICGKVSGAAPSSRRRKTRYARKSNVRRSRRWRR
jgi:hypothetical protein